MAPRTRTLQSALVGALVSIAQVRGHGIATALVRFPGGTFFKGYNPSYQYQKPEPVVVGWSTPDDLQNTFVPPEKYSHPDIACHLGAKQAQAHAPVSGGDVLSIQWTPWPESHKGPVLDYLALCDTTCDVADKTKLPFFKIAEAGLVDSARGLWAGNVLMANNNSWLVKVPTAIAPGNYVLRHEIIALHAAGQLNGAQNYPFCFNLAVSGNGTDRPAGVLATQLYKADHPGIKFDLFRRYSTYQIPGPTLYTGGLSVSQAKVGAILATSSGIPGLVIAPPKPTTASAAPATPVRAITTGAAPAPTAGVGAAGAVYSTKLVTTKVTVTTKARVTVTTTLRQVRRVARGGGVGGADVAAEAEADAGTGVDDGMET